MTNLDSGSDELDGINEINITPFVDVVLVLLVIFMVAAPVMIKESLKVNLPKTLTSEKIQAQTSIGVGLTKFGEIIMEGENISVELFQERLKEIALNQPQTQFLISADVDSKHGDLIRIIDALKQNNLHSFALQVERVKK
jgi:biopolymer transport protein ExbD